MDPSKLFISWSGDRSRIVAEALRSWLPLVLDRPLLWLSTREIADGARWFVELSRVLDESQVGLLVLTPENVREPWILFEAGALSKDRERGRVLPYLVGLDKEALAGPLGQFQAATADKAGTWSVIRTIAGSSPDRVPEDVLKRRFEVFWPELETCLNGVTQGAVAALTDEQATTNDPLALVSKQLLDISDLVRKLVATTPIAAINTPAVEETRLADLEGAWVMRESNSHMYVRIINGELMGPYCFGGDSMLTSYFYNFRRVTDYWFARFQWLEGDIHGFTFLKYDSRSVLTGAWWYDEDFGETPSAPVPGTGNSSNWVRRPATQFPPWAEAFFEGMADKRRS